jgi:RNA polymerase sigma factor (TIGR02999 family)
LVTDEVNMGEPESGLVSGAVTRLIGQAAAGDERAQDEFCELVYEELRAIARRARRRSAGCSLATTEVVNEFLGRILADGRLGDMKNRRYFYATAADQMRRILIDHWRRKQTISGGGQFRRVELEPWLDELTDSAASRCGGDLEALDAALTRLKRDRPRQHEIVVLKFFAGITNQEAAETLDISIDTVKRDWQAARARLGAILCDDR